MIAGVSHARLSLAVVALMAHILRIVLLVEMRALEGVLFNVNLCLTVYCLNGFLLEVTDRVFVKAFE